MYIGIIELLWMIFLEYQLLYFFKEFLVRKPPRCPDKEKEKWREQVHNGVVRAPRGGGGYRFHLTS